jgi:hypothetical protein
VRPKCRRSSAIRLRASLRDHSKHKPARATTALAEPGCQAGHIRTGCWMLDAVLGSRRFASASLSSQSPSPSQPPGPVLLWPFLSALALLTLASPKTAHCRDHPSQANVDCSAHWGDKGTGSTGCAHGTARFCCPHHHTRTPAVCTFDNVPAVPLSIVRRLHCRTSRAHSNCTCCPLLEKAACCPSPSGSLS